MKKYSVLLFVLVAACLLLQAKKPSDMADAIAAASEEARAEKGVIKLSNTTWKFDPKRVFIYNKKDGIIVNTYCLYPEQWESNPCVSRIRIYWSKNWSYKHGQYTDSPREIYENGRRKALKERYKGYEESLYGGKYRLFHWRDGPDVNAGCNYCLKEFSVRRTFAYGYIEMNYAEEVPQFDEHDKNAESFFTSLKADIAMMVVPDAITSVSEVQ